MSKDVKKWILWLLFGQSKGWCPCDNCVCHCGQPPWPVDWESNFELDVDVRLKIKDTDWK